MLPDLKTRANCVASECGQRLATIPEVSDAFPRHPNDWSLAGAECTQRWVGWGVRGEGWGVRGGGRKGDAVDDSGSAGHCRPVWLSNTQVAPTGQKQVVASIPDFS